MKSRLCLIVYLCILYTGLSVSFAQINLSGKVSDQQTGEALVGVSVYFPDLKIGASTDINGEYKIQNLPKGKYVVQLKYIGYSEFVVLLNLDTITTKDFILDESVKEMNEVVVTGLSQASERKRIATPITTISTVELQQNTSTNIIDAIAKQPGISQITTGSGISKPVIRGLGYNRVLVVNDGIRQEGQQWGDEHGIEIDEYSVSKVEVLKGPASLAFGSDAMAGVINMISAPSLPEGKIAANLISNYQTNNGLIGNSINLSANLKGFIWDARFSNKQAHAYSNKYDGYVYGSGYNETNYNTIVGVNKSWGYSHLHLSSYNMNVAIVEGDRDSTSGQFIKPIVLNDTSISEVITTKNDFTTYLLGTPHQSIHHYKAVSNNSFIIGKGQLKVIAGFQQNQRKEFGDVFAPSQYGLYFLLNTINYDVRYVLPEKSGFQTYVGINGMQQLSQNKGTEFLVPAYNLFDIGAFATIKKSFKKLDLSGGIRFDQRQERGEELFLDSLGATTDKLVSGGIQQFTAFTKVFNGYSGSLGATYQFSDKVYSKFNLSRGFRMPNIGELGANGEHEGVGRYEIGNSNLKPENSLQTDLAFGIDITHLSIELDVFNNSINNFIYLSKLSSKAGTDSIVDFANPISTFEFKQGDAVLNGGELRIDIHPHPLDWLHFENSISYVQATQKNVSDSTKYLPFTPPTKITSELKADAKRIGKSLRNVFVKVEVENFMAQKNIFSAFGTETATASYTIINSGFGGDVTHKGKVLFSLFVSVNNIADVAYQSHLSRLKYAPANYATGRIGVYNMGRNGSFKIRIPINIK